jgi:peroxiredoxin Q/BCP
LQIFLRPLQAIRPLFYPARAASIWSFTFTPRTIRRAAAQQFRDLYAAFHEANCEIVGISRDSIKSHENFKAQFTLPFALLSDASETACNLFGTLKLKNMYGKQVRGIERSTFVLDKDGILRREWRGLKADGHAQEVLDFVTTLN